MSASRTEQITTHTRHRSTMQRDHKRRVNRWRRRTEKRDPENAPTRNRYLDYTS